MKKILVLAFALLTVGAVAAQASTDCCFDRALPRQNGKVVCVEVVGQAACWARAGSQIYAPDFDCPNNNADHCQLKSATGICEVEADGGIAGVCSYSDLSSETPAPGMSTVTLGVLLTLLAGAAVWMLARRRSEGALA